MSALAELFGRIDRPVDSRLSAWEDQVTGWCRVYCEHVVEAELSEINLDVAVFVFDHTAERVVLAYAISIEQLTNRDSSRIRGFPNVNASVKRVLGAKAFTADKGHFLGHASGGVLDINLFPQRRELNRGWSPEGKRFRRMERYVAEHAGTFFYHRPQYDDDTWIPNSLEYGVLPADAAWWVDTFKNR